MNEFIVEIKDNEVKTITYYNKTILDDTELIGTKYWNVINQIKYWLYHHYKNNYTQAIHYPYRLLEANTTINYNGYLEWLNLIKIM